MDLLSDMIDGRVAIQIDSEVVRYNIQINARTEKPIKTYKVDETGVVSEMKPEGEQVEMELDLAKPKEKIAEVPEEISREIVDEFIIALLAPVYEDMPYPFYTWVRRIVEDGESYGKIAIESDMSSNTVADLIDEYRQRVAPLASKWDEWRQGKVQAVPSTPVEEQAETTEGAEGTEASDNAPEETETGEQESHDPAAEAVEAEGSPETTEELSWESTEGAEDPEDTLSEWEQEVLGGKDPEPAKEESADDLETYILTAKPVFDDIPYDFPSLLARRKSNETWKAIAHSLGKTPAQLAGEWSKYRKRAEEHRNNGAA
jgi:hypothetical protein